MKDISILIPTYNSICVALVSDLQRQAEALGISFEIIVADDGSTDASSVLANRAINHLGPNCRYIERQENAGRAAIRNILAAESQYLWLLFVDSDMVVCREDYLEKYASSTSDTIVYGGVSIGPLQAGNLRSMYEKAAEHEYTLERRQQAPYQDFHTANFLVRRDIMLQYPFDLRFRHYGYEDVFFGKQMQTHDIPILHIDNPVSFERFENNKDFVSKTEEGLRTLCLFRKELEGYSRLLDVFHNTYLIRFLFRIWHKLFASWERENLTGTRPSLLVFKLYKIGYLASLL